MTLQEQRMEHIHTWQASGLTKADYCRQQGLNVKTFSRWFSAFQLSKQPVKPMRPELRQANMIERLPKVAISQGQRWPIMRRRK